MSTETKRIYFRLPVKLGREIDALVGPRKRRSFISAAVEQELLRRRQAALRGEQFEAKEASKRKSID